MYNASFYMSKPDGSIDSDVVLNVSSPDFEHVKGQLLFNLIRYYMGEGHDTTLMLTDVVDRDHVSYQVALTALVTKDMVDAAFDGMAFHEHPKGPGVMTWTLAKQRQ